jgi:hypothetical protein
MMPAAAEPHQITTGTDTATFDAGAKLKAFARMDRVWPGILSRSAMFAERETAPRRR